MMQQYQTDGVLTYGGLLRGEVLLGLSGLRYQKLLTLGRK